jgi:hypothetical protein
VAETARATGYPLQLRTAVIAAPKFPYGFFAGNFSAETPLVANGASAVLSWTGSTQADYTILWATHSQVVSNVRRWTSPPLTDITTFILQVVAQDGGKTVELRFSATIVVANPSEVVKDLRVLTTSKFEGAVEAANTVTVAGRATLGALNVTGVAQVASLASRALSAVGNSDFANLMVSNQCTLNGPVSVFHGTQTLEPGEYLAHTDGIVIAVIQVPSLQLKKCWGFLRGWGSLGGCGASGGVSGAWTGSPGQVSPVPAYGSFVLPVQSGQTFSVTETLWSQNEVAPWRRFTWLPFGNTVGGQPTVELKMAGGTQSF